MRIPITLVVPTIVFLLGCGKDKSITEIEIHKLQLNSQYTLVGSLVGKVTGDKIDDSMFRVKISDITSGKVVFDKSFYIIDEVDPLMAPTESLFRFEKSTGELAIHLTVPPERVSLRDF